MKRQLQVDFGTRVLDDGAISLPSASMTDGRDLLVLTLA